MYRVALQEELWTSIATRLHQLRKGYIGAERQEESEESSMRRSREVTQLADGLRALEAEVKTGTW